MNGDYALLSPSKHKAHSRRAIGNNTVDEARFVLKLYIFAAGQGGRCGVVQLRESA